MRLFARHVLQEPGHKVAAFAEPGFALEAAIADPTRFDALVTDIVMPAMSGPALAERITALGPIYPCCSSRATRPARSRLERRRRWLNRLEPRNSPRQSGRCSGATTRFERRPADGEYSRAMADAARAKSTELPSPAGCSRHPGLTSRTRKGSRRTGWSAMIRVAPRTFSPSSLTLSPSASERPTPASSSAARARASIRHSSSSLSRCLTG